MSLVDSLLDGLIPAVGVAGGGVVLRVFRSRSDKRETEAKEAAKKRTAAADAAAETEEREKAQLLERVHVLERGYRDLGLRLFGDPTLGLEGFQGRTERQLKDLADMLKKVLAELTPNGGSSIKDQVTELHERGSSGS